MSKEYRIEIEYCTGCHWLIRAAWVAQELLSTFESELAQVALQPGKTGGVFEIRLNGDAIWSRKARGRFPEIKELKKIVRDAVAPDRDLGHIDH
jgi:selenoprotein W-related protein